MFNVRWQSIGISEEPDVVLHVGLIAAQGTLEHFNLQATFALDAGATRQEWGVI
jgi:hypothetical protein